MKTTKILTVLTVFLLIFSLAACGTGKDNKKDDGNKKAEIAELMAKEPGTKDEATELHQKTDGAGKTPFFPKTVLFGRRCFSLPIKAWQ